MGKIYLEIINKTNSQFKINEYLDDVNHNGHIFSITFDKKTNRDNFIHYMHKNDVQVVSHYQSLHISPYYKKISKNIIECKNSDRFTNGLVRLPLFQGIKNNELKRIFDLVNDYKGD